MELVIHLILHAEEISKLSDRVDSYPEAISFGLKTGLEFPFVLYQMLAFSARHLAHLRPARADTYLHQAVSLQTRALSLFNGSDTEVRPSNCVAILLFSSVLGHHLLADTLVTRTGGLDTFLDTFVQCAEKTRGISVIAHAAWPMLMETEIAPVLTLSAAFTARTPRGGDCRQAARLVDEADGLDADGKAACQKAIQYLQVGIDAVLGEQGPQNRFQMIFSWTMLLRQEFTALLAARKLEALVILGHYFLLLHYGRELWQVGDAGSYLMGLLSDRLGPEQQQWLSHPRQIIMDDAA
jgi:hypothetical protein